MQGTSTFDAAMELVRSHIAHNTVDAAALPDFIAQVHASLLRVARASVPLAAGEAPVRDTAADVPEVLRPAVPEVLRPAVPISESVTDSYVVCLEDGTRHQMMRRYLMRMFGMKPEEYRAKWGLAKDHPVTAPAYSERKRLEARHVGLGTRENKRGAATPARRETVAA